MIRRAPAVGICRLGPSFIYGGSMSTVSDFMVGLLDLVFFLFDKQDNVLLLIPFTVIFWCLSFAIIKFLMHLFLR